jgi:serine/threonine protein kinase
MNSEPGDRLAEPELMAEAAKTADADDPFIAQVLADRYRIEKLIGRGAWGNVYLARHLALGNAVAIKMLHPLIASDRDKQQRLEQEAHILSQVDSQYIVKTLDYGLTPVPFIVLEYFDGTPLSDELEKNGALQATRCIHLFGQLCEGLKAAHAKGIVHRDLKPSNILVNQQEDLRVKIVDFGIAKVLVDATSGSKLTATGEVVGSPPYMAPEQWLGGKVDERTDIYALGCIMYEAAAGKQVFDASNGYEYLNCHLNQQPAPLKNVSTSLDKVIRKCLQKRAEDRYASVGLIILDLNKIKAGDKVTVALAPSLNRRAVVVWSFRLLFIAAVLLALSYSVSSDLFSLTKNRTAPQSAAAPITYVPPAESPISSIVYTPGPDADKLRDRVLKICADNYPRIRELFGLPAGWHNEKIAILLRGEPGFPPGETMGNTLQFSQTHLQQHPGNDGVIVYQLAAVLAVKFPPPQPGSVRPGWLLAALCDYARANAVDIPNSSWHAVCGPGEHVNNSSRCGAAFLLFVESKYPNANVINTVGKSLVAGSYNPRIWQDTTGKTLNELATQFEAGRPHPQPAGVQQP